MQINSSTNASLLDYVNSIKNGSSSTGNTKSGIGSLLQQSCVAANPMLTKMSQQAENAGLYKSAAINASAVVQYLKTLSGSSDESVFAKAEEEGSTDVAVTKIGSMVVSYNKLLDNLSAEGGKTNQAYLKSLYALAGENSEALEKIGITLNSDGTLGTDYATLCDADVSDLKNLFGSGASFGSELSELVTQVSDSSAQASNLAQIYSTAYSSSGSYSQYEYIKNFYNNKA